MVATKERRQATADQDPIPGIHMATPDETWTIFDRRVRQSLHIPGEEFIRRWDAGDYQPIPMDAKGRKIRRLAMMLPFARRPAN